MRYGFFKFKLRSNRLHLHTTTTTITLILPHTNTYTHAHALAHIYHYHHHHPSPLTHKHTCSHTCTHTPPRTYIVLPQPACTTSVCIYPLQPLVCPWETQLDSGPHPLWSSHSKKNYISDVGKGRGLMDRPTFQVVFLQYPKINVCPIPQFSYQISCKCKPGNSIFLPVS